MTEGRSGTSGGNFRDRMVSDYQGYKVYDRDGEKLGKVEYTVLDESEQPQYLGVKTGFFGTKTTLIPEELIRLDDNNEFTVEATESQVNDAPTISDEDDVPQNIENDTLSHYGLGGAAAGTAGGATAGAMSGGTNTDSDYDDRNRSDYGDDDRSGRDRNDYSDRDESRSEGRDYGDRDESRSEGRSQDDDYDRNRDDSRSSSGALGGAAAGAGAGAAASGLSRSDRGSHDDHDDTEYRNTSDVEGGRGDSSSSRSRSGGRDDGEKIRVTLKREQARAERVIDEDGEEEVRIRKKTIREEVLIDVEDAEDSRRQ